MNPTSRTLASFLLAALTVPAVAGADAPNLSGSHLSMERQHEAAIAESYNFLGTPDEVRELVRSGVLDQVTPNTDLELANVSFPYARPEVKVFVERLAAEYRSALGERLVITSLTRPVSRQPSNAHELSVHPAGMAVDFRIPARSSARLWLERRLLELEREGVLDVTRERNPPHYHVAVYPAEYRASLEKSASPVVTVASSSSSSAVPGATAPASAPAMTTASFDLSLLWMILPTVVGAATIARRKVRRAPARVVVPR